MINDVRDTLKGGYGGLYGEVVTCDTYQLRDLRWTPNLFVDLGANVGVATRFAQELWPNCKIVAVEPDTDNFKNLIQFTRHQNTTFINKAIGSGKMWTIVGAVNGAHEMYINEGVGYPELSRDVDERLRESGVETILLDEIWDTYGTQGSVLKLDIEGNEMEIFAHPASMEALRKFDYICGETHPFAMHGGLIKGVEDTAKAALMSLSDTHEVRIHHINFWITRK